MQKDQKNQFGKIKITNCSLLDIRGADIIVNSAMAKPAFGSPGTVDYSIYDAAGKEMLNERKIHGNNGYLKCSECISTDSYGLKSKGIKKVIHVNVPSYFKNKNAVVDTNVKLLECYYNALNEAVSYDDEPHVVAFPLLGTGAKGFKYPAAVELMHLGILSFFSYYPDAPVSVIISIINPTAFQYAQFTYTVLDEELLRNSCCELEYELLPTASMTSSAIPEDKLFEDLKSYRDQLADASAFFKSQREKEQLLKALASSWEKHENTLSAKVLHYESLSGYSVDELTKKANISRKQYHSIVNTPHHNCSFNVIVGLCVAFNLTLEQSEDLLQSARMSFDYNDQGCQIIMRGIKNKELSPEEKRDQINEDLYKCGISYVYVGNPK